nr:hypothetical protein [Chloroflexaceae bacterium]
MTNLFNKLLNKLTSEDTSTWFVQQVVGGPGDTVYALTIAEGRQKFHAQLLRLEGGEWVQLCADKHDEICESFAVGIRDDVMVTRSGGTLWMWEDGEIYELGSLNVHSPLVVPFDEETFLIVGFNDDNIDVAFYYDILH